MSEHFDDTHADGDESGVDGDTISESSTGTGGVSTGHAVSSSDPSSSSRCSSAADASTSANLECPICGLMEREERVLSLHVNSHFEDSNLDRVATTVFGITGSAATKLDDQLGQLKDRQKRLAEADDFRKLRLKHGVDTAIPKKDGPTGRNKKATDARGPINDTEFINWPVHDFIDKIRVLCASSDGTSDVRTCTHVSFFATSSHDQGFGCGYRNAQMLLSSLAALPAAKQAIWGDSANVQMFSVRRLQLLIEQSWQAGFDPHGRNQLRGALQNTRKWIGATEIAALLRFLHIRAKIVDFHRPTGQGGSHPEMFQWIWEYFGGGSDNFLPPLYLQHDGHSRTVIGIERTKANTLRLLLLDPGWRPERVTAIKSAQSDKGIAFLRHPIGHMKKRQFQIVAFDGVVKNEFEYSVSKAYHGPQQRVPAG